MVNRLDRECEGGDNWTGHGPCGGMDLMWTGLFNIFVSYPWKSRMKLVIHYLPGDYVKARGEANLPP